MAKPSLVAYISLRVLCRRLSRFSFEAQSSSPGFFVGPSSITGPLSRSFLIRNSVSSLSEELLLYVIEEGLSFSIGKLGSAGASLRVRAGLASGARTGSARTCGTVVYHAEVRTETVRMALA